MTRELITSSMKDDKSVIVGKLYKLNKCVKIMKIMHRRTYRNRPSTHAAASRALVDTKIIKDSAFSGGNHVGFGDSKISPVSHNARYRNAASSIGAPQRLIALPRTSRLAFLSRPIALHLEMARYGAVPNESHPLVQTLNRLSSYLDLTVGIRYHYFHPKPLSQLTFLLYFLTSQTSKYHRLSSIDKDLPWIPSYSWMTRPSSYRDITASAVLLAALYGLTTFIISTIRLVF